MTYIVILMSFQTFFSINYVRAALVKAVFFSFLDKVQFLTGYKIILLLSNLFKSLYQMNQMGDVLILYRLTWNFTIIFKYWLRRYKP